MSSTDPSDFGLKDNCFADVNQPKAKKRHRVSREFKNQLSVIKNNMKHTVHPQLLTEPLLFIKVPEIIDVFFEEENALWQRVVQSPFLVEDSIGDGDSLPSRNLHSPLPPFENDGTEETLKHLVGRAFLEHSESCNEIHQYFLKLDPRRCCVNARVVDENTVFQPGPLKRVKSGNILVDEARSSKQRRSQRGSRKTTRKNSPPRKNRVIFVHKLSAYEENIYKHALLCAFQPVLSCPINEPSSNTPQVISPGARSEHNAASPANERESIESFIEATAVEPQFLFHTIMHAFQINLSYHMKLRDELKRSLPNKDTARALAVDLADQLYRLQANDGVFYRRNVFASTDFYEEWRQKQITFVERLMNKWCPGYSDINSYKLEAFDAHAAFIILVDKFLRFDLEEKLNTVRDRPRTVTSLLTTNSTRLLKEFCLRYGICRMYRSIIILSSMIDHLDFTDWYLSCLETTLLDTIDYVLANQRFLVNKEKEILKKCIQRLHCRIEYGFVKMYTLYPHNLSEEGVRLLLILLRSVMETKDTFEYWDMENVPIMSKMIKQYIKLAVVECYNALKDKAELDSTLGREDLYKDCLSADTLGIILQDIRRNVNLITDLCENCPLLRESCEDIIESVAQNFYKLFMSDIKSLCYNNTTTIRTTEVDYQMIGLSFRLDCLDRDWEGLISPLNQKWRVYYKVVLTVAIYAIKEHIMGNITKYIMSDTNKLLSLSSIIPPAVTVSQQSPPPHQPFPPSKPVGISILDRKGSSAFVAVRNIRDQLRKGSCVSIEVNLKKEWQKSQMSLTSSFEELCSDDNASRSSSICSSVRRDDRSLSDMTSEGLDEIDRDQGDLSHDGLDRVDQGDQDEGSLGVLKPSVLDEVNQREQDERSIFDLTLDRQDEVDHNNNNEIYGRDNVNAYQTSLPSDVHSGDENAVLIEPRGEKNSYNTSDQCMNQNNHGDDTASTNSNHDEIDTCIGTQVTTVCQTPLITAAQNLVQSVMKRALDSLEDTRNLKDDFNASRLISTDTSIENVVKDVLEALLKNIDQKIHESPLVATKKLQTVAVEYTDENDYRISTIRPMNITHHITNNIEFDSQPSNIGVVRKRDTRPVEPDSNSEDELAEEILLGKNSLKVVNPKIKHRPTSQPASWNTSQQAALYSIYGPQPTDQNLIEQQYSLQDAQPEDLVAFSYESNSSLLVDESKKLTEELNEKYEKSMKSKEEDNPRTRRLKYSRQSLQSDKPLLSTSNKNFSKSLSNLSIREQETENKTVYADISIEEKMALYQNGFVMTTSSLTDILVACSRLISFSVEVCSLVIPSNQTPEKTKKHNMKKFNVSKTKLNTTSLQDDLAEKQQKMKIPKTFAPKDKGEKQNDEKLNSFTSQYENIRQKCENDLKHQYSGTRIASLSKVLTSIRDILISYGSSLLSLDLCGSKLFEEDNIFTKEDLKLLKDINIRNEDLVPGCRHCLTLAAQTGKGPDEFLQEPCPLLKQLFDESLGNWELVTKEMCFRINNIFSLLYLLPILQQKAADSLQVDLEPLLHECDDEKESSVKYSNKGPSDRSATFPTSTILCFELRPVHEFLEKILHFQIKLLTCRAMTIFSRLFDFNMSLPLYHRPLQEHMSTCKHHLVYQMKFFHHSMYEECVHKITIELWKAIINSLDKSWYCIASFAPQMKCYCAYKKYHSVVDNIHDGKDNPRAKGMKLLDLLISTRNYLLADRSLETKFYQIMKPLLFRLELFSAPYKKLYMIYEATLSNEVFEIYCHVQQEYTFEELIHMITYELRRFGKPSFTGKTLLDVLRNNEPWVERLVSLLNYDKEIPLDEIVVAIAQHFLRKQIIRQCGAVFCPSLGKTKCLTVMQTPPSHPTAKYQAPVRLLNAGMTIDVLAESTTKNNSVRSNDSNDSNDEYDFYETGIFYTFRNQQGALSNLQYIGRLHSVIRSKGKRMNLSIQKDIIQMYRYDYRYNRTKEVIQFFDDFTLPRPHVRSLSCFW